WVRLARATPPHAFCAAAATSTARSTVEASPRYRVPTSPPVAGFMIGWVEPDPGSSRPSIQCVISYPMGALLAGRAVGGVGGGAPGSAALRGGRALATGPAVRVRAGQWGGGSGGRREGRCGAGGCSSSTRAGCVCSSGETSETGTPHQPLPGGFGPYRSVLTTIAVASAELSARR